MIRVEGEADLRFLNRDEGADGLLFTGEVAQRGSPARDDGIEGCEDLGPDEVGLGLANGGFHGFDFGEGRGDLGYSENEFRSVFDFAP